MLESNPQSHREDGADDELEYCLVCGHDYVNPVEWEPLDGGVFWMLLRCGGCETWREATVSDAEADRFDEALDRGLDVIRLRVAEIERRRMERDGESFLDGLRAGNAGPDDLLA